MTYLNLRRSADYADWFDGYAKYLWSDRNNPQFDYVPSSVNVGSLIGNTGGGANRFLIVSSAAPQQFSDGITITGYGLDGKVAPVGFSNRFADAQNPLSDVPGEAGIGVFDDSGRWAGQIDYYEDHPIYGAASEKLVIDFGGTVTNLSLTASMVGSREEAFYNEAGKWTAYGADGKVVGTGYISPEFGRATDVKNGYGEYVIEVDTSKAIARISIEAVAFDASIGAGSGYKPATSGVANHTYNNELLVNPRVGTNENNSDIGLSALSYDRVSSSGSTPEKPSKPTPPDLSEPGTDDIVYRLAGDTEFFGSVADVVNAGDNAAMAMQRGSIAFGFDADTVAGTHALVSKDAMNYDGGGNHFSSWIENGTLYVRFEDESSRTDFVVTGIDAGIDYDVLATFDQNKVGLYLDGALIGTKPFSMDWTKNTQDLEIGGFGWTDRNAFDGTISDVSILDRVITPQNSTAPEKPSQPTPPDLPETTPPAPDPKPGTDGFVYRLAGDTEFSGSAADVVNAGDTAAMAMQRGSIAFGFDADTVAGTHALVSKDAMNYDGGGNHFSSWIENGTLYVRFEDESSRTDFVVVGIDGGIDYDVLATFDQNKVGLYLDGALIGTKPFSMDWTKNTQDLEIGGFGWTDRNGFDGTICDVSILDRVITPQDYDYLA